MKLTIKRKPPRLREQGPPEDLVACFALTLVLAVVGAVLAVGTFALVAGV